MTAWNRIERGSGRPLILLHGGGASARCWLPLIGQLAAERHVVALDFPGFGDTPPPTSNGFLSMDWAIDQIADQLSAIGIDTPVDVAGNSMGGWMSLELAKRGLARSAVAIAPAGLWRRGMPPATLAQFQIAMAAARLARTPAVGILARHPFRRALLAAVVAHPERITPQEATELYRDFDRSGPMLRSALRIGATTRFTDGHGITVPITVAFCEHDWFVRPRDSQFRDQLPDHTTWLTLENCGHVPMWDDPPLVAQTILRGGAQGQRARSVSRGRATSHPPRD
jgi:pimeloyl-ACP methyl ester carboxylesterase